MSVDVDDRQPGPALDRQRATETFPRLLPWVLTAAGGLGLLAALDLSYERLLLATDPTYRPTCSINPLLDCRPGWCSGSGSCTGSCT